MRIYKIYFYAEIGKQTYQIPYIQNVRKIVYGHFFCG